MEKLCSYCRSAGHHRGKCPLFQSDVVYIEKFREVKTKYEREFLYENLPIGSIISMTVPSKNEEYLCVPTSYKNLDSDSRNRMEHWAIEKPYFTRFDKEHSAIVNRLFADRKWKKEEEKQSTAGVFLLGVGNKKLKPWSKEGQPDFFTFGEINYEIRYGRVKVIS